MTVYLRVQGAGTAESGRPADRLPAWIAGLLGRCLRGESVPEEAGGPDPHTRRVFSAMVRRLLSGPECVGVAAILTDLTAAQRLREKQEEAERKAFWAELAGAISHEVRNPLVAINTYAQLLRNALEAVARVEKPAAVISAARHDGRGAVPSAIVYVQDNGKGIPEEIRDKVWSPLCTRKARGIGPGLPIVRRIVTDHDGQVAISSNEQGTRVTIVLPAAPAEGG